jgi:hypothetical protein
MDYLGRAGYPRAMASIQYPKSNQEKAVLYAEALVEVRMRLRVIQKIGAANLPDMVTRETVYLQLRLCVECFAIGCLAAQGDFQTHKSFKEEYSPVLIFKALSTAYPDFFPVPSKVVTNPDGTKHFDAIGRGDVITREELETIWQKSGDRLHRTSAKKFIKKKWSVTDASEITEIGVWTQRFWSLIMNHRILLSNKNDFLVVAMDRTTDAMQCDFILLDRIAGTATIEPYTVTLRAP